MINRYRRAARSAGELALGPLLPLEQVIPELCQRRPTRAQWEPEKVAGGKAAPRGGDSLPRDYPASSAPVATEARTCGWWFRTRRNDPHRRHPNPAKRPKSFAFSSSRELGKRYSIAAKSGLTLR
jgi:hypothetical protein